MEAIDRIHRSGDGRSREDTMPAKKTEVDDFDPERTTVHEAMGLGEGVGDVFRSFGMDTCCGGGVPVATAARSHGVPLDELLAALAERGLEV